MKAPIAKKIPHQLTCHGHTRVDNYYWLNDRNNPDVIAHLECENRYTEEMLLHTKPLQDKLFKEMTSRIKQDDSSVPVFRDGYYYYSRYEEGQEYPIYCRKKDSLDNEEEIVLNGPEMAKGYAFFAIGSYAISTDGKLLAYTYDTSGDRNYTICFKDLTSHTLLADTIKDCSGNITWAADNRTLFYGIINSSQRPYKIMRHEIGSPITDDVTVYEEKDDAFVTFVGKTKSREYLIIGSESTLSSEFRYIKSDQPTSEFKIFQKRLPNTLYSFDHLGNYFYILTNADDAINFKIMKTPIANTTKDYWKQVIAHRDDVMIEDFDLFNEHLVIGERKAGIVKIRVMSWDSTDDHYIDFGETVYSAGLGTNIDLDSHTLRLGYTSMTTPHTVYDYDISTRLLTLLKRQEIVGGYEPSDYHSERLIAISHDNVEVPISIVYKKDIVKNGNNPLVLYGYGSYGSSMDVYFSQARLSLLDRGFIWAIAHIRGGEEMGRQWYEDGKMLHKKNTFEDFIACAKHLINQGYTSSNTMFAMGGSAGGMLMGAVANMEPKLWRGIIAQVPFVDVVTTMLDPDLPLTIGEYDEWGNPNEKEYYDYMLSYSPYDNVKAQEYPTMLVTTGLNDSQVQYWEPAKWVAKLRELKTDNKTILFKIEMEYGHAGASGRFESFKELALEYAFILNELNMLE